jgi:hypothetical protein
MAFGLELLREWRALQAFKALDPSFHELVFYSEGPGDWPHIGPIIERLLGAFDRRISYLTSDPRDPGLAIGDPKFRAFQIGSGSIRTILFRTIRCRHFVMTLPDLQTFNLKRSEYPVHYVYLFHAINSTHTVYRKGAFDAFDTVLCVGPHHVNEIRRTEAAYGLKPKELIEHGSAKLDTLLESLRGAPPLPTTGSPEVLVAPSWGDCSMIEQPLGEKVIEALVGRGIRTVLRLHPMTVRRRPRIVPDLRQRFADERLFVVEEDMNATAAWLRSDVMISDWSGAAIEYSFSLQKPVVYLNTAQKINNPDWERIGLRGFEDTIRFEIGRVVEPLSAAAVPDYVIECRNQTAELRSRLLAAREQHVFNIGRSTDVAARYLSSLA